jgi:hypothetical protein
VLHRVNFSGVGLHRAMFATELRCHLVTFTMMASDVAQLAALALTVNNLSFAGATGSGSPVPTCVYNYAVAENLLHRIEPVAVGSRYTSIAARITIGADGGVRRVHVIVGSPSSARASRRRCTSGSSNPMRRTAARSRSNRHDVPVCTRPIVNRRDAGMVLSTAKTRCNRSHPE